MKQSDKLYLVINILRLDESTICRSIADVASIVSVHRNTISVQSSRMYGQFYVKPMEVDKKISNPKGNPDNFKKGLF